MMLLFWLSTLGCLFGVHTQFLVGERKNNEHSWYYVESEWLDLKVFSTIRAIMYLNILIYFYNDLCHYSLFDFSSNYIICNKNCLNTNDGTLP